MSSRALTSKKRFPSFHTPVIGPFLKIVYQTCKAFSSSLNFYGFSGGFNVYSVKTLLLAVDSLHSILSHFFLVDSSRSRSILNRVRFSTMRSRSFRNLTHCLFAYACSHLTFFSSDSICVSVRMLVTPLIDHSCQSSRTCEGLKLRQKLPGEFVHLLLTFETRSVAWR